MLAVTRNDAIFRFFFNFFKMYLICYSQNTQIIENNNKLCYNENELIEILLRKILVWPASNVSVQVAKQVNNCFNV